MAEERSFDRGEHLFYEGEEGDYQYAVLEGEIRVVGTFSILDRQPCSASAVAIEPTRTLAIHRADLAQILADNYSLVEGLFKHLIGIILDMNERVSPGQEDPKKKNDQEGSGPSDG